MKLDSPQFSQQSDNSQSSPGGISRRDFFQWAAAGALLPSAILSACAQANGKARPAIPSYLPSRLAICYYGWGWITTALPEEPFGNVDQVMKETKERGFNCVRVEAGVNWIYDLQGQRRGKLKFTDWIPGLSSNLHCVDAKGGGVHDVFDRMMQLFAAAEKYDMYVILTSWEYQDAVCQLDDKRIRDEILAVPYSERLMLLARQYDRLLVDLKKRGYQKRIAQVEVINELNTPPLVCSPTKLPPQTMEQWSHRKSPKPGCSKDEVRALAHDAVGFLRERHSDLLITVDGLVACYSLDTLFPDNAQVVDHHAYSEGLVQAFWEKCKIGLFSPEPAPDPVNNAFLKSMLKPNPISWEDFLKRTGRVREEWWSIAWLYENLDNRKFDEWCLENYSAYDKKIKESLDVQFACAAKFAQPRKLPLVVDEGYILYPPLHSKFLATPQGRRGEEYGVDAAIATGHWGILLSGYFRPDTPLWKDAGQSDWARGVNKRILANG